MEPNKEKGPPEVDGFRAGQNASLSAGRAPVKRNPLMGPQPRQVDDAGQPGGPGGLSPEEMGRAFGIRALNQAIYVDNIVDNISDDADFARLSPDVAREHVAPTDSYWFRPPSIHAGGEAEMDGWIAAEDVPTDSARKAVADRGFVLCQYREREAYIRGIPYGERVSSEWREGLPLVSEDMLVFANADENQRFWTAYTQVFQDAAAVFKPAVVQWHRFHYPLDDKRNLHLRLDDLRRDIDRAYEPQAVRDVNEAWSELLTDFKQQATNDAILDWHASRLSDADDSPYHADLERHEAEVQVIVVEQRRRIEEYEEQHRDLFDIELGWDVCDTLSDVDSELGGCQYEPSSAVREAVKLIQQQPPDDQQAVAILSKALPTVDGQADQLVQRFRDALGQWREQCQRRKDDGPGGGGGAAVAGQAAPALMAPGQVEHDGYVGQGPFPIDALPPRMADYCRQVAEAHVVDESLVALAMLAVAGAAMGNAWRLKLKPRFIASPLLWVAVVGRSGSNKTAPLNDVVEPLRKRVPIDAIENALLNPQGRAVVSNITVEAVIARLDENKRGLLCYCNELAGWVKSFNAYKKQGADEQAWLEFWDAAAYQLDRKTDNEQVFIPAASVAVLGGIQPLIFAQCFDPAKFASGLVPRLLVTMPDHRSIKWTETSISDEAQAVWADVIQWLRARPFASLDCHTGQYQPHMLTLTPDAKAAYVEFYDSVEDFVAGFGSEHADAFASKARMTAGRITLILQGMRLATGLGGMADQVDTPAVTGAVRIARWCLAEQLRVFGFSEQQFVSRREDEVATWMRTKGGRTTVRELHRTHGKRYKNAEQAKADLDRLVASGKARWDGKECVLTG